MRKPSPSSSIFQRALLSPFFFAFLTLILFITMFQTNDSNYIWLWGIEVSNHSLTEETRLNIIAQTNEKVAFAIGEANENCDIFTGKWVHDIKSRPTYEEEECPYLEPQTKCQAYGRPDKEYQHWRWEPHGCSIPSFNATLVLENLRGKILMFVGDSLNRNQFFSMVCLLSKVIPKHAKSMKVAYATPSIFIAKDYNATIEFYWAPFLLQSNADPTTDLGQNARLIKDGSIYKHGNYWLKADILVFNTYLWWKSSVKLMVGAGFFDDERKEVIDLPKEDAYRMAIQGLRKWVDENINLKEKRVFFNSMSPTHKLSKDWGGDHFGSCYNETSIIDHNNIHLEPNKGFMKVIDEEFSKSIVPITYLNITHLSSYRKDGHTSIYSFRWRALTDKQLENPIRNADCIHWCLPGVPDVWNEILFWKIFYP